MKTSELKFLVKNGLASASQFGKPVDAIYGKVVGYDIHTINNKGVTTYYVAPKGCNGSFRVILAIGQSAVKTA